MSGSDIERTDEEKAALKAALGIDVQEKPDMALIVDMRKAAVKVPSIGRIVHYRAPDGSGIRAAMVTDVHGDFCVNLFVFLDAVKDYSQSLAGVRSTHVSSVMLGDAAGEWNWPIFVPGG